MESKGTIRRAVVAAQIEEAMRRRGISRKGLAEKMGRNPSEVTKWLSGTHNFTIDLLSAISEAVGEQITGVVCDASGSVVSGYGAGSKPGSLNDSCGAGAVYGKQFTVGPVRLPAECYHNLERKALLRGEELSAFVKGILLKEAAKPAADVWRYCGIWKDVSPELSTEELIGEIKSHRSVHKTVEEL